MQRLFSEHEIKGRNFSFAPRAKWLDRSRIPDKEGNGLMKSGMEGGVDLRNTRSWKEMQQQKVLLHVCIVLECGTTPVGPAHFRAAVKLATARPPYIRRIWNSFNFFFLRFVILVGDHTVKITRGVGQFPLDNNSAGTVVRRRRFAQGGVRGSASTLSRQVATAAAT
ncbi:hypothetical protein EVAR_94065_1 [Eumeta japonica]|uniref:Uncharacterized protein n=1 Tax=Eumeta variegata TaxID=151549 RepID=A0A4C1V6X2_EUMVA|nr:hypothetical protein EVAR_94065_1 [Eumeta japonica]